MSVNNLAQSESAAPENGAHASFHEDFHSQRTSASPVGSVTESADGLSHATSEVSAQQIRRHQDTSEEESEEDEEDENEPRFKYLWLTKHLGSVYRRDDSTSATLVSGDKKHVLNIPSLLSIRQYHAHSASVTAISISPPTLTFPISHPSSTSSTRPRVNDLSPAYQNPALPTSRPRNLTPSLATEATYIATASYDGHVCVSALADPKNVILRNFSRPIQAVALSPEYSRDRIFLSGGLAGNLILTVGGRIGVSSEANTNRTAAAASGWLNSFGLGSNDGVDSILHSGEGSISTISWSISGKYVAWVNEKGIKIMRSSIGLDGTDLDQAWKRIAHIDHPRGEVWDGMASVWKARTCWVDDRFIENVQPTYSSNYSAFLPALKREISNSSLSSKRSSSEGPVRGFNTVERLLVAWGNTVWVIDVRPVSLLKDKSGAASQSPSKVNIVRQIVITDGIISGLSAYSAELLLVIVFRTRDDSDQSGVTKNEAQHQKGFKRQHNALQPDLRLIDFSSEPVIEVDVASLPFPNFESRSAADYHLSTLFIPPTACTSQTNARHTSSYGIVALSDAIWDASRQSTRLLSSSSSLISGSSGGMEKIVSERKVREQPLKEITSAAASPSLLTSGLKVFVHSPYDCVLAVKQEAADRLSWLLTQEKFEDAWKLLDKHPETVSGEAAAVSRPDTPPATDGDLSTFFEDDTIPQVGKKTHRRTETASEKEKRRIGNLWVGKLIAQDHWRHAAEVAGKVIETAPEWEHWIRKYAEANKFDEIVPHMPCRSFESCPSSAVYELILEHYLETNLMRFQATFESWDVSLFATNSMAERLRSKLDTIERSAATEQDQSRTDDRFLLLVALARIYVELSLPTEALYCYLRTKNGPAALDLISRHNLLSAISDRIFSFITVNISDGRLEKDVIPTQELDRLSAPAVQALASGARRNLVSVAEVVQQLQPLERRSNPFLFFYFRALWNGDLSEDLYDSISVRSNARQIRRPRFEQRSARVVAKISTRALLAPYVKLAVSLFAEYSRPLLGDLLRSSEETGTSLTDESEFYEHALTECERREYIPELVHLSSATGQNRRALHLIIDKIGDVKQAISFAKELDDAELWQDLLEYSMDKPVFVKGLLLEGISAGCRLRSEDLVRRIPDGLDIPGLKAGLVAVLRDNDVQSSIAEGAARVAQSEVTLRLEEFVQGRKHGVLFEKTFSANIISPQSESVADPRPLSRRSGLNYHDQRCAICTAATRNDRDGESLTENLEGEYLLAFSCGHVFHLACILRGLTTSNNSDRVTGLWKQLEDEDYNAGSGCLPRHINGTKTAHAQMIANVIGDIGCKICDD